jgi:hypothetical protein
MAPPTGSEQLIRDYLNRLSVAARDLTPDDRRALLERTRGLIEQKADLARRPSTMDVARVLARLGDPARLVEQERRRLGAQGGSPRSAAPATSAAPAAPGRQRFLARALGREHGRLRGPSLGWPLPPDSRGDTPVARPNGAASGTHQPEAPTESEGRDAAATNAGPASVPEAHAEPSPSAPRPLAPSPSPAAAPAPADAPAGINRQAGADRSAGAGPDGTPAVTSPPTANGTAHAAAALPVAEPLQPERPPAPPAESAAVGRTGSADESATAADAAAPGSGRDAGGGRRWRDPRAASPRGPLNRQVSRLLAWARKRPLEAAAIVVMGIGGPIFPPVFLIGATLALASELWDGRDKWVGLALPIVLTVTGLAVGVAAGGRAHWMHESWVYLDVVSRVAPALGAGYLAWRCHRPRRPSSVPPFSRSYRTS